MKLVRRFLCIIPCCIALTSLSAQTPSEIVTEIRIHGNARIADDEIIRLSGLHVGQALEDGTLMEVEAQLRKSGRFDSIEVRKRYRSLEDFSQVALLLVVHEKLEAGGNPITRPLRQIRSHVMFMPILKYDDGYGWTYGVLSSTVNLLGLGERLSVPLSWGGTRRAAVELERGFENGPLSLAQSSFGISRRINPRFLVKDQRVEVKGRVERKVHILRFGGEAGSTQVHFGPLAERLTTFGGNAIIDTRGDPAFPSNAVYAFAGWRALNRQDDQPHIGIVHGDLRGYWRPIRQAVLAARVQYEGAVGSPGTELEFAL